MDDIILGILVFCVVFSRFDLVVVGLILGEVGIFLFVVDWVDVLLVMFEVVKEDFGLDDFELMGLCFLVLKGDGDGEYEMEEWDEWGVWSRVVLFNFGVC